MGLRFCILSNFPPRRQLRLRHRDRMVSKSTEAELSARWPAAGFNLAFFKEYFSERTHGAMGMNCLGNPELE